ncbi:PAS domain-containing protein [Reichenbachiella versicolor]|uniref:PAS domain-containing protein n=1 Tax=Reichenbachiella versicolor TaxID=1821036 RepID=UPI0013A5508A|nr:PAS domain-containing protein [Reichenbachiella versicolor]
MIAKEKKSKTQTPQVNPMPLMSWDIFMFEYQRRLVQFKKESEMKKVLSFTKKFNWKNDLITEFSKNHYEALIITDRNQNIIWVNDGFTTMTGYSKRHAINKTPRFLQGDQTCQETKKRIRQKITQNQPFHEVVVNHRKDNSLYKCEVKIIPLYNEDTTHFIAFERQVG